jgi:uncharacterized protein YuzE
MKSPDKELKMKKDYDFLNDSLFMYIEGEKDYKESIEVGDNLILDFDKDYKPISFEILNISQVLGVKKFSIKNLKKIIGNIGVSDDTICVRLSFIVPIHEKKINKPILMQTKNDIDIPNTQLGLATV